MDAATVEPARKSLSTLAIDGEAAAAAPPPPPDAGGGPKKADRAPMAEAGKGDGDDIDIDAFLQNSQNPDARIRAAAEAQFTAATQRNLPALLVSLIKVLADEQKVAQSRMIAGLRVKNALTGRGRGAWMGVSHNAKKEIKDGAVVALRLLVLRCNCDVLSLFL